MERRVFICVVVVAGLAGLLVADHLEDTEYLPLEHPAILYNEAKNGDPAGQLAEKLDQGQVKLAFANNGTGYLVSLLKELRIPIESQVLVFSRTSIQAKHISPRTPRAIYFNDGVSVGFVQYGEVLEITSLDPVKGVKMYTLDADQLPKPVMARRDDCLQCHQGPATLGIPGLLISSVHPSVAGARQEHGSAYMTDHRSALNQRFGGWFVTGTSGTHGEQFHQGNNPQLADPIRPGPELREGTQNVIELSDRLDISRYPAGSSDIVAMMTLEHQVRMTNLLVRLGWETRMGLQEGKLPSDEKAKEVIANIAEEVTGYMLFSGEAALQEPISGTSTFSKNFAARGPRDSQGRSLRDFDLKTRLFRYPLSYMIYSAAFDQLPKYAREVIYQDLHGVLSGKGQAKPYAHLSSEDRQAILQIVRATKKDLPEYWSN